MDFDSNILLDRRERDDYHRLYDDRLRLDIDRDLLRLDEDKLRLDDEDNRIGRIYIQAYSCIQTSNGGFIYRRILAFKRPIVRGQAFLAFR